MPAKKLVIFDYSGTLSLESVLFGRPDYLMKELEESGLMAMGITSPAIFWEQIVNPTWVEGSTTGVGYKKIIENRVSAFLQMNVSSISKINISDAASSFVDSYLSHSRIDRSWQPVLRKLDGHPFARAIIATDHYAEATGYILQFLKELHIQAAAVKRAIGTSDNAAVIVANSADLGFHKDKPRFWEILRNGLNMASVRYILVIDDFGCNEEKRDSYGAPEKVEQRKRDTVRMLQEVFSARVQAIPFMMEDRKKEALSDLVANTSVIIDRYLAAADDG